jgi:hypothetical protein
MTFYQAYVEVITPEYKYWNKLGAPSIDRADAEGHVAAYIAHKANGTGGYRKGAPARTRIDSKTI